MTIVQMKYFFEVCRAGSVSKAAETLGVSQPSVSSALRQLEDELEVNLFHRVKKRFSLTKEGEFFFKRVEKLLAEIDSLTNDMKNMSGKHNPVRIGVPPMMGTFIFPAIFHAFHKAHPEVEFELVEFGSRKIREMVANQDLDIAFAITGAHRDTQLNAIPIMGTSLLFSVNIAHPLAKETVVNLAEVAKEPLIMFRHDSEQATVLSERFAQLGVAPNVLLASEQIYTIKKMLAKGTAGAFLFREVVAMEPDIIGIPLSDPIDMEICLIWKREHQLYNDTVKLIDFVKNSLPS